MFNTACFNFFNDFIHPSTSYYNRPQEYSKFFLEISKKLEVDDYDKKLKDFYEARNSYKFIEMVRKNNISCYFAEIPFKPNYYLENSFSRTKMLNIEKILVNKSVQLERINGVFGMCYFNFAKHYLEGDLEYYG